MAPLLRLATAGSVDDGKSTLIGRLLLDSKAILEDQLASIEQPVGPDLAALTDGLRAEREQGITIDVAYRYFATPKRKFIIADTPGHVQYTRNMVTGTSTADLVLTLVDARYGVLAQSRRHALIASLLGVSHLVLCVNKMDLVGWSRERFEEVRDEFLRMAARLEIPETTVIPLSALRGDNIVHRSTEMPWYEGAPLLQHLEEVPITTDRNLTDLRLPVQYVIRGANGYRSYAGTMASGVLRRGDEVTVLPSGLTTTVEALHGPGGTDLNVAFPSQAVAVRLTGELDIGRGDLLCQPDNRPTTGHDFDAVICWLTDAGDLTPGAHYRLRHTTRSVRAKVRALDYRLDTDTLHRDVSATALSLNDIGRISIQTHQPLNFDAYRRNRDTGSFILVDEATGSTVAAGMIDDKPLPASNIRWHSSAVTRGGRTSTGGTVWLTGLSASGKSTIATELEHRLVAEGRAVYLLDGDNLRHGLSADLGFSAADRTENVRRVAEVARLFADAGIVAIVSLISPYRTDRDRARHLHEADGLSFAEVYLDAPLRVCEQRDPKGLYARARARELVEFTGIDAPYEPPTDPELTLHPHRATPVELAEQIVTLIGQW
ncbi:adenylyl-sulfate kinase [Streptomyces iconiensis]|uniref:Adenylyl-sulfate kinase n=1 Tax=Streptomyces iconiensis TaxID=1384038 RepID=A0ABT7A283_9ACTN|nr:adenylyl-sulfate kinase [Streptomyces iconiensis]MDJ1135430.1 adenylyl-sulfate kinase [Streptomyces iconiensis]